MRPDIPWNVAGIPMEAREAARAAARREGLSVGEWMTRRILRSFSDTAEAPAMREAWSGNVSNFSSAVEVRPSRRDTEEMLARVARTENESGEVFRRIEEQLRGVARRLEAAERSQSENNRAMTKAATEINITAREQAQAFDQLGNSVIGLADRLDRVERATANEGLREAVKGLHQGLSRLADQITATANQSATQISSLADNLESVAGRLGEVRTDAEAANQVFDQRIAQIDERMHVVERLAQAAQAAVEQALASLDARKEEDAAAMKRDADAQSAISRLETSLSKLQTPAQDPALDRRLSGIERTLAEIAARFDQPDKATLAIEADLERLTKRVEASETAPRVPSAIRTDLTNASNRVAVAETQPTPSEVHSAPVAEPPAVEAEAPPFVDVLSHETPVPETEDVDPFASYRTSAPSEAEQTHPEMSPSVLDESFEKAEEESVPHAPEAETSAEPEVATNPATADSYLTAARRSARLAAAQAEADIGSRITGFSWGSSSASLGEDEVKSNARRTYLVVAIIALVLILAIAAGAFLSQRIGSPRTPSPLFHAQKAVSAPAARPSTAPVMNAVVVPSGTPATSGIAAPNAQAANPQTAAPLDKLTALANSGNANAELIVGLKYLDGDGVAVSEPEAAKWLERAAIAGLPVAQYRLGTLYERGRGVPLDAIKSVHWYTLAAQAGNRKAMHNLAVAYASGTGVTKDLAEAARWFSKAASLGLSDSQFNLAVLYERGLGVPQSLLDAYKWYAIAAASGDAESKARIDALATQLSAEDRAAAQRSVNAFHPQPLDPKANVPPQMSNVAN